MLQGLTAESGPNPGLTLTLTSKIHQDSQFESREGKKR